MMRRGDGGVHFQMAQAVAIRCFACGEGGLGAGRALLNKTARRSSSLPLALRISLLAAALLAVLVWTLRLLAKTSLMSRSWEDYLTAP